LGPSEDPSELGPKAGPKGLGGLGQWSNPRGLGIGPCPNLRGLGIGPHPNPRVLGPSVSGPKGAWVLPSPDPRGLWDGTASRSSGVASVPGS